MYDALSYDPLTVDHLVEQTGLPVPSVMASLLSLELLQRVDSCRDNGISSCDGYLPVD